MKKIIIYFLKKTIKKLNFHEESLEMNQDLIENVNEEWQKIREYKNAIKKTIEYLNQ